MQMLNLTNAFNNNLFSKIVELNKHYSLLKNIIEEENKFDPKYKTELCKKFQSTGKCPYGPKCRFAHGKEELISKAQGANYKKKKCKSFNEKGYCPYGSRCNFRHDERKFSEISFSYFYLQLFLFKQYNFLPSRKSFYSNKTTLLNERLPIFESLTTNKKDETDKNNLSHDKFNNEANDKNNSFSTISNTSNEEIEQKKYIYNDSILTGLKSDEFEKIYTDKSDRMNENDFSNHINKENISGNVKF